MLRRLHSYKGVWFVQKPNGKFDIEDQHDTVLVDELESSDDVYHWVDDNLNGDMK